jgi:hypothetical protein
MLNDDSALNLKRKTSSIRVEINREDTAGSQRIDYSSVILRCPLCFKPLVQIRN